jgi:methylated-DNA-[protein]-cysteine S-methyltransferase
LGYELHCTYLVKGGNLIAYSLHYSREDSLKHLKRIVKYHGLSGSYIISESYDAWLENELKRYLKTHRTPDFVIKNLPKYKNFEVYEFLIKLEKTTTYSELSKKLNRLVWEVIVTLARNPFLILIPCHRVVRKDGGFSGYTPLGKTFKQKLLEYESLRD